MKLKVFYHVMSFPRHREIFSSQFEKISQSGLLDAAEIYVTLMGEQEACSHIKHEWDHPNIVWCHEPIPLEEGEHPTWIQLQRMAQNSDDCFGILYLNQKGVTHDVDDWRYNSNNAWREYLDYWCIIRWRDCVSKLQEGYDAVGTEWNTSTDHPDHFAGSACWMRSDFVKRAQPKLVLPSQVGYQPQFAHGGSYRHDVEFWIGANNPKVWCWYNSHKDLYHHVISPEEYQP